MAATVFSSKNNRWREYLNPLRWLSVDKINQMIEFGERGSYADLQWFYQSMERADALIASVLQRRRSALLTCSWEVQPELKPSDGVLAQEQAAYLRDCYDRVVNLREAVAFLATAAFRGYAHVEKNFDAAGNITRLESVEQWFWCRDGMFGNWTYNRDAKSGVSVGEPIERGNFVLVESSMALDRILSMLYYRRNLCMTDWDGYLEVYGIPSVFFVGPPGLSDPVKEAEYIAIAQDLMKDGRGYLPNGTTVTYVNGGGSGKPPFRDHLDYVDKQIVLVGTGGLLTMLAESGSGTLAGGAHSETFRQVAGADAALVGEAFRSDFDKPLLDAAFPGWPVEAGFCLTVAPEGGSAAGAAPVESAAGGGMIQGGVPGQTAPGALAV